MSKTSVVMARVSKREDHCEMNDVQPRNWESSYDLRGDGGRIDHDKKAGSYPTFCDDDG